MVNSRVNGTGKTEIKYRSEADIMRANEVKRSGGVEGGKNVKSGEARIGTVSNETKCTKVEAKITNLDRKMKADVRKVNGVELRSVKPIDIKPTSVPKDTGTKNQLTVKEPPKTSKGLKSPKSSPKLQKKQGSKDQSFGGNSSGQLVPTPFKLAEMTQDEKNNNKSSGNAYGMMRSATTLESNNLPWNVKQRISDSSERNVRPASLLETDRLNRKSDPTTASLNSSSILSFFDGSFLRFGLGRSSKPKAITGSNNNTPQKQSPGHTTAKFYTTPETTERRPTRRRKSVPSRRSYISPPRKNKEANDSAFDSKGPNDHDTSGLPRRGRSRRRKKSIKKGFFGNSSQINDRNSTDDEKKVDGGVEKKWARSNSLRRPFHSPRHNAPHQQDPAAHSDTEIGKISGPHSLLDGECGSVGGSVSSERAIDVGRVGAWATSFEKLLEDPAGLHTFSEFLKKEYSHENIYFWTACERYKRLSDPEQQRAMAKEIFERHLVSSAPEPVNVDSQARQHAQDGLHNPNEMLFAQAQKQIFNLMKFDSYTRFLKSNLYKDCETRDLRGQTLPYPGDHTLDPILRITPDESHVKRHSLHGMSLQGLRDACKGVHSSRQIKLKKSRSDAEERRRKSLLPWNRKDRSKSKDRGETEYRRRKKQGQRNTSDSSSIRSDISGSRTSLNSSSDIQLGGRRALSKESLTSGDLGSLSGGEGYGRCRVMLPDLSNSVVAVKGDETIQGLLSKLLERRGITYSTFDAYFQKTDKLIDKSEDSSILGGQEVRIERRILFRLDLPGRKTVCVKAKPGKQALDVLKPILLKYGYKMELMFVHKVGEEKGINLKCQLDELDGQRLVVQTKEEVKEWGVEGGRQKKRTTTLDEITNKVFEDLLKGKADQNFDELGILDFDARSTRTDNSSDRSSGILGSFSRRNSLAPEKDSKGRKGSRCSVQENIGRGMLPPDHALITKRRGNNPTTSRQENDELYEGLKRAQRSRLDDQRGTEINFELPDFLKCDQPQDKENQHAHLADQLLAHLECSFSDGAVIPTHQQAEDYFSMAHPEVWGGLPASPNHSANATLIAPDLDLDFDETLRDETICKVQETSSSLHVETPDFAPPPPIPLDAAPVPPRMPLTALPLSPPPLPPKPKVGGVRGPPPRPPSRQLHLLNPPPFTSTSDDDAIHSTEPSIHISRQTHDKFNISFV